MGTRGYIKVTKNGEKEKYFRQDADGYPEVTLCELSKLLKSTDTYNVILDKLSNNFEERDKLPSDDDIEWQYHIDLDDMKIITYYHTFTSPFSFTKRKRLFRSDNIGVKVKKGDIEQWDDDKYYGRD